MKNIELMKQKIRNESGDSVLVLARLQLAFDENIKMLRYNMGKAKVGSKTRLDYIRAISSGATIQLIRDRNYASIMHLSTPILEKQCKRQI